MALKKVKLSEWQKEYLEDVKHYFTKNNVRVFFSREAGIMIALEPADFQGGDIYRVHTSLCNMSVDRFQKKLGLLELGNRWQNDMYSLARLDKGFRLDSMAHEIILAVSGHWDIAHDLAVEEYDLS